MPKCPECGEEIETLNNQTKATIFFECRLDKDGSLGYSEIDDFMGGDGEYYCPICDKLVASTEMEAIKMLKGGSP